MTDKKEIQYYLVKYQSDLADEMDIYGLALLTNHDKEKYFDSLTEDDFPQTHYVGTNEDIEYKYLDSLLNCYTWIPISKREYNLLFKLIKSEFGEFYYPEKLESEDNDYDE